MRLENSTSHRQFNDFFVEDSIKTILNIDHNLTVGNVRSTPQLFFFASVTAEDENDAICNLKTQI